MTAILLLSLHCEFFAPIAPGTKRIGQSEPVTAPGVPQDYPDAEKLVPEDCIRP